VNTPPVLRSVWVPQDPAAAFALFTDDIGAWWPVPSHGLFGERSGGVAFVDGELREGSTDGEEVTWGEVREWDPPHRFVMSWHPGRPVGEASEVEVSFVDADNGTQVLLEHRGWERFGSDAAARRRSYIGPGTWGAVLEHFTDVCEPLTEAADLTALESAYERFLAEASGGGFAQPSDGGWTADETIAHVALNDLAIVAVTHQLIHGQRPRFENVECQEPAALSSWIAQAQDRGGVLAEARRTSTRVLRTLARLNQEQRATEVHCRLLHDGEVMTDGPRPWGAVAIDVQAGMHLPAHVQQLQKLRA